MPAKTLLRFVRDVLEDAKGQNLQVIDVRKLTDITDYMLLVTGTSTRHVLSMMDKVVQSVRQRGERPLGVEGEDAGEWVLIDLGDVVVHIMRAQARSFYNLEKLWGADAAFDALEV
jgi:ribosome-associated protein